MGIFGFKNCFKKLFRNVNNIGFDNRIEAETLFFDFNSLIYNILNEDDIKIYYNIESYDQLENKLYTLILSYLNYVRPCSYVYFCFDG